ncbi:hypothetical protein G114_15761 [Aeromonas diversa CDC 2478-85]|uniref:SURF1-like protein n=1 Tax=Aeromonas diversa CDC 2478-85 TaxID=1268237 RepID=N9V6M6_9GAMM|nr:hypothetical protein G114_15761 [Aeromonas diversa CDC 2478-85]
MIRLSLTTLPTMRLSKLRHRLLLLTLIVSALLFHLALWQWHRASEKEALLARLASHSGAPLSAKDLLAKGEDSLDGLRLNGQGDWLSPHLWLLDNQVVDGIVGYDVIIPVQTQGGPALLVNLGWTPAPPLRNERPALELPATLALDGLLRRPSSTLLLGENREPGPYPSRIQSVRPEELRAQSALPLGNLMLYQQTPGFRYHYVPSVMSPERHRAYAAQWLGLALVVLAGGIALTRRSHA